MAEPDARARQAPWRLADALGAFFVAELAATVLATVGLAAGASDKSIPVLALGLVGEWTGFVGGPLVVSRARGTGSLVRDFGLTLAGWRDIGRGLAAGIGTYVIVLGLLYPPLLRLLRHLVGHKVDVGQSARQLSREGRGVGFLVFALLVAVGAPLAEELFFRGLLMRALQRRLGVAGGIVGSAVIFGLVHLLGGTEGAAVPALVTFGIVLGVLYHRTGRLGPGVVAHMAFNGITVAALAASR